MKGRNLVFPKSFFAESEEREGSRRNFYPLSGPDKNKSLILGIIED